MSGPHSCPEGFALLKHLQVLYFPTSAKSRQDWTWDWSRGKSPGGWGHHLHRLKMGERPDNLKASSCTESTTSLATGSKCHPLLDGAPRTSRIPTGSVPTLPATG